MGEETDQLERVLDKVEAHRRKRENGGNSRKGLWGTAGKYGGIGTVALTVIFGPGGLKDRVNVLDRRIDKLEWTVQQQVKVIDSMVISVSHKPEYGASPTSPVILGDLYTERTAAANDTILRALKGAWSNEASQDGINSGVWVPPDTGVR